MWTSKSAPVKKSECMKGTGRSLSIVDPLDLMQGGDLIVESSCSSMAANVVQSLLQCGDGCNSKDKGQSGNKLCSTVYVNHQGHTVKMARLADPPPLISFPVKGLSAQDNTKPVICRSLTKSTIKSKKSNLNKGSEDNDPLQSEKPQDTDTVTPLEPSTKKQVVAEKVLRKPVTTAPLRSSSLRSRSNIRLSENDSRHVNRKSVRKSDPKDSPFLSNFQQSSVIKEELKNGLQKITADLVALKVLDHSNPNAVNDMEKSDHKRPLPVEQINEDSEETKENNSPCKRSRRIPCDLSLGENSLPISRLSLNGSCNNFRPSQTSEHLVSSQSDTCSTSVSNTKKSFGLNAKAISVCEKPKSYDPEKAREYIRQQKKERMNRLKAERDRKKAEMDARRLKLSELSQTSSKLVKASIKSKSNPPHSTSNRISEDEDKSLPTQINFKNSDHSSLKNGWKKQPSSTQSLSESTKCLSEIQSVSPDLSNSQLIRDISDMKSKIEAMARTLKTTIVNNRGKRSSQINRVDKRSVISTASQVVSDVDDKFKSKPQIVLTEKQSDVIDDTDMRDVMPSNISPEYLHSLTSNLRKMRESLQTVLTCSESSPSETAVKDESGLKVRSILSKHRRFSSAGSDSAFGNMFTDSVDSSSLKGNLQNKSHRQKLATSFPILSSSNSYHLTSERSEHCRSTSEADITGITQQPTILNVREESSSSRPLIVSRSHKKDEGSCPTWYDKFVAKPYPVNVISAVKHKLSGTVEDKSDGLFHHESSSTTHQNPQLVGSKVFSGAYEMSIPTSTMTVKAGTRMTTSLSTPAPNLVPPNVSFDSLGRRGTFPSSNLIRDYKQQESTNFQPISPVSSSILEALNLEKMNNEFENALSFPSNKSDIIPAEKPLSAPNTPAKSSEKVVLQRSEALNSEIFLKTKEPGEMALSVPPITWVNRRLKDKGCEVLSSVINETASLIPPNVNLVSGVKDGHSVGSSVSHPRNSTGNMHSGDDEDRDSTVLGHKQNASLRDTFEIGHVFNPTALHLQFQAELNILDSFNESLCQVMEIEKVRAVALARHQVLQENHGPCISKADKSIDIQKSLMESQSQISSINYVRGSGDLSDVTTLDSGSSTLGMVHSEHMEDDNQNQSVKEEYGSPSTNVSDTHSACGNKPPVAVDQSLFEEAGPRSQVEPSLSTGKSVSEDIQSTSDDLSEAPEFIGKTEADEELSKTLSNSTIQGSPNEAICVENKNNNRDGEALSLDITVNSLKSDSTLTGNEALFIESLSRSECHIFPSSSTGDDMFQFTLQMLEQLMHEEDLRVQHKNTLLKLRVKVLGEMAHAEVASLNLDKKKLRGKGEEGHKDQISALRKKQRGIMLRFQQQREEIERLRRTEELAWQERRLMYLQQMHLIRMQVSTRAMLHKFEKSSETHPKKSRVVFRSIRENRSSKSGQKGLAVESSNGQPEAISVGLSLTHSSSVSLASLVSDASRSSVLSNSSRRPAGDSESSHLEDRVLKGLNELENRCRDLKEREKVLHEKRQSVENIIQWRRKLEEEEHRLKDAERQAHGRHRSNFSKHALRDRSTSPFQFLDSGPSTCTATGSTLNCGRSISDLVRTGRTNNANLIGSESQSASASITEEIDSSVPEEISENTSKPSADSTPNATNADQYANESFESEVSEIKTVESKLSPVDSRHIGTQDERSAPHTSKPEADNDTRLPRMSERSNKYPGVTIKVPLSPRLQQRVQRRRYSSGSDDSMVLSQTETGSEQSDIEGRISALTEQLQQCKAEAERLRREAKRTRNERLIAKEQSLHKQLQAYETYICQLRTNLDAELKQSSVPIVRPQIKQPRVAAGKVASRRQDAGPPTSVSQATSPDVTTVRKDDSEFEAVAIASEAPSEAASEVPSDVASEVSENSSLLSNEAPSLVANKLSKDVSHVSNEEERTLEALTDASETGSEILSAVITDVPFETNSSQIRDIETDVINDRSETGSWIEGQNNCSEHQVCATAVFGPIQEEIAEDTEPARSITSEEEPEDISELHDDEHEGMGESEGVSSSEVIKVFLREKDKNFVNQTPSIATNQVQEAVVSHAVCSRSELVDRITNEILEGLMKECLQLSPHTHSPFSVSKHTQSADIVWDLFIHKSLAEATNDILDIYKKKKAVSFAKLEEEARGFRTQDVRKRVSEILAEAQSPNVLRAKGRVREMMVTTYGVSSPDDSPCGSPSQSSSPIQLLQPSSSVDVSDSLLFKLKGMNDADQESNIVLKANDSHIGLMGVSVIDSEGISQEWFDEDFGLTHSRREAEELRRQQLQIEQEIEQLQQQQAQVQEQIPYYYVREIPNKPPPPYTPPGQAPRLLSSSSSLSPPNEEVRAVCSDRPTILKCISSAVDLLHDVRLEGKDLHTFEAPSSYIDAGFGLAVPSHLSEQELLVHKNSARAYRMFLFDLARELVLNAYSCEQEDPNPPWLRPENWVRRRRALAVVPQSREALHDLVSKQVLVLFGFIPKASKENLTIRWSRKKRDHVDELLVRESQEEERLWTNYEQDEAVVKNNVTLAILDSLLDETVRVLNDVYRKRSERQCTGNLENECSVY